MAKPTTQSTTPATGKRVAKPFDAQAFTAKCEKLFEKLVKHGKRTAKDDPTNVSLATLRAAASNLGAAVNEMRKIAPKSAASF